MSIADSMLPNGLKIRQLRESKGWSQKEVFDRAGVDERSIRRAEAGILNLRTLTLRDIATCLGVTLNTIRPSGDSRVADDNDVLMLTVRRCSSGGHLHRQCLSYARLVTTVDIEFDDEDADAMASLITQLCF